MVFRLRYIFPVLLFGTASLFGQRDIRPVARFTFNDQDTADEIGGIWPRLVGVSYTEDRFGNENSAVYLRGTEQSYINLGSSAILKPKEGSISFWFKLENIVYAGRGSYINPLILTKNSARDDFYEAYAIYYFAETQRVQAASCVDSLNQFGIYSMETFKRLVWHHLALTYSNDSCAFYIDGKVEKKVIKGFESRFNPLDSVMVGVSANLKNNRFTNGIVDDIMFFDKVLTGSEIRELYHAPNPNRSTVMLHWLLAFLGLIVLAVLGWLLIRSLVRKEIRKGKEKVELAQTLLETELRVNRALMNPHFVFNSLNSLQNLILEKDYLQANNYLVRFSRLMRRILESNMSSQINLGVEMELLERYLEIENLRFREHIRHTVHVDPQIRLSAVHIPVMMLQPFVENAVWHGLRKKEGEKVLKLDLLPVGNKYLMCVIEDNGIGRARAAEESTENRSLATLFIMQRLDLLNKIHHLSCYVNIEDKPGGAGTIVSILLPVFEK